MAESKRRRAIRKAVEERGGTVTEMYYEPIGQMIEMSGREGGWTVVASMPCPDGEGAHEDHFLGYDWYEVVEHIELEYPLAAEPGESER